MMNSTLSLILLIALIACLAFGQTLFDQEKYLTCYANNLSRGLGLAFINRFQNCYFDRSRIGRLLKKNFSKRPTPEELELLEELFMNHFETQNANSPCTVNLTEIAYNIWGPSVSSQPSIGLVKFKECYKNLSLVLRGKTRDQICNSSRSFIGCLLKKEYPQRPTPDELTRTGEEIRNYLNLKEKTQPFWCAERFNITEIAEYAWGPSATVQSSMYQAKITECFTDLSKGTSGKTSDQICNVFRSSIGCVIKRAFSRKPTREELNIIDKELRNNLEASKMEIPCTYNMTEIADKIWNPPTTIQRSDIDQNKFTHCFTDLSKGIAGKTGDEACNVYRSFIGCFVRTEFAQKPSPEDLKSINWKLRNQLQANSVKIPCAYNLAYIADNAYNSAVKTRTSLIIYYLGFCLFLLFFLY